MVSGKTASLSRTRHLRRPVRSRCWNCIWIIRNDSQCARSLPRRSTSGCHAPRGLLRRAGKQPGPRRQNRPAAKSVSRNNRDILIVAHALLRAAPALVPTSNFNTCKIGAATRPSPIKHKSFEMLSRRKAKWHCALVRAVSRLVSTPLTIRNNSRSHERERGTRGRVRHVGCCAIGGVISFRALA